jgi:hypothetical protein
LDFYPFYFAKEKSSSIFARTFAKAEWVAKSKEIGTKIENVGLEFISVTIPGRGG